MDEVRRYSDQTNPEIAAAEMPKMDPKTTAKLLGGLGALHSAGFGMEDVTRLMAVLRGQGTNADVSKLLESVNSYFERMARRAANARKRGLEPPPDPLAELFKSFLPATPPSSAPPTAQPSPAGEEQAYTKEKVTDIIDQVTKSIEDELRNARDRIVLNDPPKDNPQAPAGGAHEAEDKIKSFLGGMRRGIHNRIKGTKDEKQRENLERVTKMFFEETGLKDPLEDDDKAQKTEL